MAYKIIKQLPTFEEIVTKFPISDAALLQVNQHRLEIEDILSGKDQRKLVIVGPCSAWPSPAVLEYAQRLLELNDKVKDKLKLVMRVYIQKPRTIKGWTGPLNQPNPLGEPDIESGIAYARGLMVKIVEMGIPIADEALFTHNSRGFLELLSWVAIGARSSEDQEHRIFASSLDFPVGIKNPTHGSLKIAVNSVVAAQHSHRAVFDGYEVETTGNQFAHLVLRGSAGKPNYATSFIEESKQHMDAALVLNPAIIVDASHDNCIIDGKKDYSLQSEVILRVMDEVKNRPQLGKLIKGFMLESFIKGGKQDIETVKEVDYDGLSITDPCLSFTETQSLLIKLASLV